MIAAAMALMLANVPTSDAGPADAGPPYLLKLDAPTASNAFIVVPKDDGFRCVTGYGDCWRILRSDDGKFQLQGFDMDPSVAAATPTLALPGYLAQNDDGGETELWDQIIRLKTADRAATDERSYLVGIIRSQFVGYSRGFASAKRLYLFRFSTSEAGVVFGPEVLNLPWTGETQVRACFGVDDEAKRRDACHDIYRFIPALTLDPAGRDAALPALIYSATATAFPRTSRRGEDNSAKPALTAADLSEGRDPDCSFTRRFEVNALTGRYDADVPGPTGCEDRWTVPQ